MDIRIVDGNLVKDAEVKIDKRGVQYLSFTLANNAFVNQKPVTTYFNVVSYSPALIEKQSGDKKTYVKGKAAVVTGHPKENITVKDGKAYLNRYLNALNIETHNFAPKKEENGTDNATYHDVAPVYQAPQVPQATVTAPTVQAPTPTFTTTAAQPSLTIPDAPARPVVQAPTVAVTMPQAEVLPSVPAGVSVNVDDDLPF